MDTVKWKPKPTFGARKVSLRPILSIVVPCFNEAETIIPLYERISRAAEQCAVPWELLLIDDGSRDQTGQLIGDLSRRDRRVKGVIFSRNFGHQAALTAGMKAARGEAVVTLDADLQHPPELIPSFFHSWRQGARVVQGVRRSTSRAMGKAVTSRLFYAWLNRFAEVEVEPHAADYRLLDRHVVNYLNAMPERGRFLRGQLAWLGFPLARIEYDEEQRYAGTTKYTLRKMFNLAKDAVTSSSLKPLFLSAWLGLVLMLAALGYAAFGLAAKALRHTTPGWTSLMLAILIIGAIELMVLSIHGLYIGQLCRELRARPLFCVTETHGLETEGKLDPLDER